MAPPPIFSPLDFEAIVDCTLQYHFLQQIQGNAVSEDSEQFDKPDSMEGVVLETIRYLHAAGGPNRVNLPSILRYAEQIAPEALSSYATTMARQMIATYHRRLKTDWSKIIASNELMQLNIRLSRAVVRAEAVVDRLDKETDGGLTAVRLMVDHPDIMPNPAQPSIEMTMYHALAAAAYPRMRPIRIKYIWLRQNQETTLQLSEAQYRHNLDLVKARTQRWLDGEVLARPGTYCDQCQFQYQGCPIYENTTDDLSQFSQSATLSAQYLLNQEGEAVDQNNESDTES